ncbi:MAG: outer membrane protein [Hyphomicrobiaceae bacterium]
MSISIRFYGALLALSLFLVAYWTVTAVHAADLRGKPRQQQVSASEPRYEPAPPPIWQGLYWGASIGYGWGDSEHFYDRNDNHGLATNDLSGGLASLTLGYNHIVSPGFLVGIEGDIGLMNLSADDKVIFDGHVWKAEFGPLWGTVRARAGMLWGNTLLYGTGGWAITEVDEVGYGDAAGQTAYNESVRSGWVLGAGVEHAFRPGMTAKLEYLHMDFGSYEGYSENREDYSFENRIDLIRVGLNVKY